MRVLGTKLARFAVMALIGGGAASALYADNFVVSYNAAGSQEANPTTLCSTATICWVGEETFGTGAPSTPNSATPASYTILANKGVTGNGDISGTYSTGFQYYKADQYGGAGGTGDYAEVKGNWTPYTYSLTLSTSGNLPGVNYFGLWFSALDANNQLEFYEVVGTTRTLVETFTTADFIALVGSCPSDYNGGTGAVPGKPFCGNPTTVIRTTMSSSLF